MDEALDLPREPEWASSDLRSSTKTDTAFPVDFFFASYILQGPDVDLGALATV
jgi:hypothetical protein